MFRNLKFGGVFVRQRCDRNAALPIEISQNTGLSPGAGYMRAPTNANSLVELSDFCAWSATELPERISIRKRMTKHLMNQSKRDRTTPSGERLILSYGNHYKRVPENAAINP